MTWRAFMLGTAAAALTLSFGTAALAEEGPEIDYNRLGGFFQVSGVYAWPDTGDGYETEGRGGFAFRFGNRFHEFVSCEFQYEFLDERLVTTNTPEARATIQGSGTKGFTNIYTHQATFNFRAYPWSSKEDGFFSELLAGRVQPYAVTGIGAGIFVTPQGDGVGFVARMGGGLDTYITEHIVFTMEAVYAFSAGGGNGAETTSNVVGGVLPLDPLDHVSVSGGLAYRF